MSVIATAPPGRLELRYVAVVYHAGRPALQHTSCTKNTWFTSMAKSKSCIVSLEIVETSWSRL